MNIKIIFILLMCSSASIASIFDYIPNFIKTSSQPQIASDDSLEQNIPYEVATPDEKFIAEAALLTGVALSDLDSCQHRVVLKLQTECHKLNDEQVSKLAVMLLNCQSAIEGRPIYQCTEYMSLRECTSSMDPDIWNSYHIMTNRARAVCYSVRQSQFRGLTEMTVNKLMHTAHEQLKSMTELGHSQDKLQKTMLNSIDSIHEGQDLIQNQQKDIQRAQLQGQLAIESNIQALVKEKALIKAGNEQIAKMTQEVKSKLDQASTQIDVQSIDQRQKHNQILNDLLAIQTKAESIWQRIESSTNQMIQQSQEANRQYEVTLAQLREVNATVAEVFNMVAQSRQVLDSKLSWLTESLGGTGNTIDKLWICCSHIAFLVISMILCAFLNAPKVTRYVLVILLPLNLALSIKNGSENALELPVLSFIIVTFTIAHFVLFGLLSLVHRLPPLSLPWKRTKYVTTTKLSSPPFPLQFNGGSVRGSPQGSLNGSLHESPFSSPNPFTSPPKVYSTPIYEEPSYNEAPRPFDPLLEEEQEALSNLSFHDFPGSPTPPLSLNDMFLNRRTRSRSNTPLLPPVGSLRRNCAATTRTGNACKNSSLPGREFCYRHQSGDSIVG